MFGATGRRGSVEIQSRSRWRGGCPATSSNDDRAWSTVKLLVNTAWPGWVSVRCQLALVAVGAGVRIGLGDVSHMSEPLAHHRLRDRSAEAKTDTPEEALDLLDRQLGGREAVDDAKARAAPQLLTKRIDDWIQLAQGKVGRPEIVELSTGTDRPSSNT